MPQKKPHLTFRDGSWYDGESIVAPNGKPQTAGEQNGAAYAGKVVALGDAVKSASGQLKSVEGFAPRLGEVEKTLKKEHATLTFGGHFNSGKSSLINALLGRSILPVDDLPETGAICAIRAGQENRAVAHGGGKTWEVICTTNAIRREVSLISQTGVRRQEQVLGVNLLEIVLKDCAIPASAMWIDSPGINDTELMGERARLAALGGDVLIWILNSRQPLSEVEMDFIADHVSKRGPASTFFILNVFLAEDSPAAWETFCHEKLPRIRQKVVDHADRMGFTQADPPEVVAVSVRPAASGAKDFFGSAEARKLILGIDSGQHPRVARARLQRAAAELSAMNAQLGEKIRQEEEAVAAAKREAERRKNEAKQSRTDFETAVAKAASECVSSWGAAARTAAEKLADSIKADSTIKYDSTYTDDLNKELQKLAKKSAGGFVQTVSGLARQHGQKDLSAAQRSQLEGMFTPPTLSVTVVNTPVEMVTTGRGRAAFWGGLIGTLIAPGIGTAVGGAIGAAAGGSEEPAPGALEKALKADAEGTRANVKSEADKAVSALRAKKGELKSFILKHCTAKEEQAASSKGSADLAALKKASAALSSLASVCDPNAPHTPAGSPTLFKLDGYTNAGKVGVAGTFNDWQHGKNLLKRKNGGWEGRFHLPAGKHLYKFVIDGGGNWVLDPNNPDVETDGSRNTNSVLSVM